MPQSVLEMSKELVQAQIQAGQLTPNDMQKALQDTYASLMTLQAKETGAVETPPVPVDWRKSISRHAITCLECGATFKQLSIRHLREHALDARLYRAKYGIPRKVSLAARDTTARRRQVVQEIRPWEKTPRYLATQKAKAAAAKKKGARKKAARAKG